MITLENADKALKDYYLQAVSAQLNDNVSPFFSAIEKTSNNVYGKDVKIAVVNGRTDSVLACTEDGDLPAPHSNRYHEISVPLKNIYGTIEVSDKAMRASRDSSGTFVNLVNAEMDGLISSAKFNFQRMLFGDGTGTLCKINSADSNATSNFKYAVNDITKLSVGMKVDIYTTSGIRTEGAVINAISETTRTITLDRAVSGNAQNASITVLGAYGNELTGLGAIFGDNKLYGHDRAAEPYFNPYRVNNGSLSEDMFVEIIDHMEENFNSKINMILCSYSRKRQMISQLNAMKINMSSIDLMAGQGVLTVNGIPVYADRFCPNDKIYFVNTDDFVLNQLCDWEWLEDEDGKILKQVPGKAAYGATLVKYAELVCKKPCAQAVLNLS